MTASATLILAAAFLTNDDVADESGAEKSASPPVSCATKHPSLLSNSSLSIDGNFFGLTAELKDDARLLVEERPLGLELELLNALCDPKRDVLAHVMLVKLNGSFAYPGTGDTVFGVRLEVSGSTITGNAADMQRYRRYWLEYYFGEESRKNRRHLPAH